MATESELRAANNDLMDPHWKPSFPKITRIGDMINDLMFACGEIRGVFKDPIDDNNAYSVTMHSTKWKKFLAAYDKLNSFTIEE